MHAGLRFGAFMPPIHDPRHNPTWRLRKDIELVEALDELGFDEFWVGEHHSAGHEIIPAPEIFIAAVAERTKRIRLGTGVTSLPYHHPLWVADRMAFLDHLTRGRTMLGVGPGSLPSDAAMIGLTPERQRPMMAESLDAIMRLLRSDEPVTVQTDWFTLKDAVLNLRPYSDPHFEVTVAATASPAGPSLAGRHGLGLMSVGATTDIGFDALALHWDVVEEQARIHGTTPDRSAWRLVGFCHLAETDELAREQVRYGLDNYVEYFQRIAAFPQMALAGATFDERVDFINSSGLGVIGTPDRMIEQIRRLQQQSGGFGCYLLLAHEWASPANTLLSHELVTQHVMPAFQGSTAPLIAAKERAAGARDGLVQKSLVAVEQAGERYKAEQAGRIA
jgi:limonene 1,2-monooxygenase